MHAKTKGERPVISGYVPSGVLADLLEGNSEPVSPEVAAERAASRIIQALRDREDKETKKRDEAS